MTYPEFWRRYLRAHATPATRAAHYLGTSVALLCLAAAAVTLDWGWLIAAPLIGYGLAWGSHALIEHNRPETFGHPVWSLASDLRMLALAATGRLARHLAAAGLPTLPSNRKQAP
jgi:hypothetical protein